MRDINRIKRLLDEVLVTWHLCPDLRLGQLLITVGNFSNGDTYPIFNLEDDKWLEAFENYRLKLENENRGKL